MWARVPSPAAGLGSQKGGEGRSCPDQSLSADPAAPHPTPPLALVAFLGHQAGHGEGAILTQKSNM